MKKTLALFLAILMVFGLAACGDSETVTGYADIDPFEFHEREEIEEFDYDSLKVEPNEYEFELPEVEEYDFDPIEIDPMEEYEFELPEPGLGFGETEGDYYENASLGIGFALPDDWYFYSDEEILALNNMTVDMVGEDFKSLLEASASLYDVMASSNDDFYSMNVVFQSNIYNDLSNVDEEDLFTLYTPMLEEAIASMGCTNISSSIKTVNFAGETCKALHISSEISGVSLYQMQVLKITSDCMATISVSSLVTDQTEDVLQNFYAVY